MMNKKRTKEIGRTKYLMFLPLAALLMIVSNIESVARTTKEITSEVIKSVESPMEQPAPEASTPQAVPQPEQDSGKVTYKGKVVDENGKPVQGVEIFSDMKFMREKVMTKEDGSFEFQLSKEAPIVFINRNGSTPKSFGFPKERLADVNRNNWIIVYNEKWHDIIQSEPGTPDNPIFEVVEDMPEFPGGGMPALMEYLNKNIKYPAAAIEKGTQGRVTVQFIVEKDGSITNAKTLRGVDQELDKEAIRVISTMPKWKPGTQRGKAVRVRFTVPVMFRLQEPKKSPAVQSVTITPAQ